MGRPSASEAPRGPSRHSEKGATVPSDTLPSDTLPSDALPLECLSSDTVSSGALPLPPRAPGSELPPRLRLQAGSADELSFVGWWPPTAPLLLCPVLLVISSLAWLSPGPLGAERLLVSLLGWSSTLLLAWCCRPRRARLTLRPAAHQLLIGRETAGQVVALPEALRWRLTVEHVPELPQPRYRALLLHGERSWAVLGNTDPAELLRDLGHVLARWPGTVEQDWQLPRDAEPWSFSAAPASAASASAPELGARVLSGSRADRTLCWAMIVMTWLVIIDLAYLVVSASARVTSVHPLSVGLAALGAACLCAISASVITRHPRLVLGRQLSQEHSILGLRRVLWRVRPQSVRGVHVLAPGSARRGHLLVDSSDGALALLVESHDAERLRQELLSHLEQPAARASESAASALRRWQSG